MGMILKGKDVRDMVKANGLGWTKHHICEAIDKKELTPHDWSLRDMATNLIDDGQEVVTSMARPKGSAVLEDAASVDTATFSSITGQLIFSAVQQAMQLDELIGDRLVTTFPSAFQDDERLPGISMTADEYADEVPEGVDYPLVGLSEEYIQIPRAQKHGGILGITREMIIADHTALLLERARSIGAGLAIRREKQILDVVIGGVNPYVRKGIARDTYDTAAAAGPFFTNEIVDALVNYTDVQAAANQYFQLRDPNTGEPLGMSPTTFLCCPDLMWTARPVFRDTSVRLGDITAAPGIQSIGNNRIPWDLELLTNEWVTMRLLHHDGNGNLTTTNRGLATAYWYIGRPRDAFVWKEIWPLTVEEAPTNNEAQFNSDVWFRLKVSYKGVAGVREPRYMIRSDGTA